MAFGLKKQSDAPRILAHTPEKKFLDNYTHFLFEK
jgi:hypothetical protein